MFSFGHLSSVQSPYWLDVDGYTMLYHLFFFFRAPVIIHDAIPCWIQSAESRDDRGFWTLTPHVCVCTVTSSLTWGRYVLTFDKAAVELSEKQPGMAALGGQGFEKILCTASGLLQKSNLFQMYIDWDYDHCFSSKRRQFCFEWSPPWHSICHSFWHSIWHSFWHYLTSILTYFLAFGVQSCPNPHPELAIWQRV